jgi:hypothetical protein
MLRRLTLLLFFLSFINAQMALPTFQGVHKPHTTTSGTPENPAQSSGLSTDLTGYGWHYLMGYRFTPQVGGTITQLGGLFDGTKNVYLWEWSSGNYLGSVSVSDPNNNWAYSDLSSAVSVTASTEYVVAVAVNGSGGARWRWVPNLPNTYGNVTINSSVYKSGTFNSTTMPSSWNIGSSSAYTSYMWGLADITFVPNE